MARRHGERGATRRVETLEPRELLAGFMVTTASDSGPGSLREAIEKANARRGFDVIRFKIGRGAATIRPVAPLPDIVDALLIDGRSQPGFEGSPIVELDGSLAPPETIGLTIHGREVRIRGLVVNRFGDDGIVVEGPEAVGAVIQGNYIGTDLTGTQARPNGSHGIVLRAAPFDPSTSGPSEIVIGGLRRVDRNVISGNRLNGVFIAGRRTGGATILGNLVGVDVDGRHALGNGGAGVFISQSPGNRVGGRVAAARNVLSGNGASGVDIQGAGAVGNLVLGNYCGTDSSGASAVPNQVVGIAVGGLLDADVDAATFNTIGGSRSGEGNLTSGNVQSGIFLSGLGAFGNVVQGNKSGTDATGRRALPNGRDGIQIAWASDNLIGGTRPGEGNLLSGNAGWGVDILEKMGNGNRIEGNFIGTDVFGRAALGNLTGGLNSSNSPEAPGEFPYGNRIGGPEPGAGNLISGNRGPGVVIFGALNQANTIQGNTIGLDVDGRRSLGNQDVGIVIWSSFNRVLENVVSANAQGGVLLLGEGADVNTLQRNLIGTDASGKFAVGNGSDGVIILSQGDRLDTALNTIGGALEGEGNVVAGNLGAGVAFYGERAVGNSVLGNHLGIDRQGTRRLPNAGGDIAGTDDQRNLIGPNLTEPNRGPTKSRRRRSLGLSAGDPS